MKILKKDFKKREFTVKIENLEDLWYIHKIIDPGDIVKGKTTRKIKIEQNTDRKSNAIKKTIFLKIQVEKQDFHEFSNNLRITGKTIEGSEDIKKGAYHTFDIEENSIISITKSKLLQYQLKILEDSTTKKVPKILICIIDRSEACFALLKDKGYDYLSELEGEVTKKRYNEEVKSNFYKQVSIQLQDYVKKYNILHIILASPSFWKEYLIKEIPKELQPKIIQATCNHVGKQGITELLKRTELKKVLVQERTAQEEQLVEELLENISKNTKSTYGIKEVKEKVESGSVKILLLTDKFLSESRQSNKYKEIDQILNLVDRFKGEIKIITSSNEPGKKLDSLGGIAAILRY